MLSVMDVVTTTFVALLAKSVIAQGIYSFLSAFLLFPLLGHWPTPGESDWVIIYNTAHKFVSCVVDYTEPLDHRDETLCSNGERCSIRDSECQLNYFQNAARTLAPVGFPAIGIPPLDPYRLQNITLPVMDTASVTMVDGECTGIRNCTLVSYETNLTTYRRSIEILCDRIVIQGCYVLKSNCFLRHLFKGNLHGCGNGSIVLEDWYFKFNYPFELVRREDGVIYTRAHFEEAIYESEILENIHITADSIKVNDRDVTKYVVNYVNNNWRIIFKSFFGKYFHKISVEYYFQIYEIFFNNTPASTYFCDDLMPYLRVN